MCPLMYQAHSATTPLFFGTNAVESASGIQQGDPCGPPAFALAILDIIKFFRAPVNAWYLDDGTIGGDLITVIEDLSRSFPLLLDMGLDVNPGKCEGHPS